MKIRLLPLTLIVSALIASGCAKKDSAPASPSVSQIPAAKSGAPAVPPPKAGPRVVEITANDQMKFSLATIEAKAGEELKLVLTNIGTMPKEAMGHNWVLLKAGSDGMAFSTAAMTAKDTDYIPAALKAQVIAHTALIGPRKSDEVTFTVPPAGEYPYLCSFPAHFMVGMKGTLISK
jgi:azurin